MGRALTYMAIPAGVETVASYLLGAKRDQVAELLETRVGIRQARLIERRRYVGGGQGSPPLGMLLA